MKLLISIFVWTFSAVLTILLFFAMLFIAVILFPFDRKRKAAHAQCYWWSDILTRINPYWNVRVKGLNNIDRKRAYVMVANHQSLADIAMIYRIKAQFKWVAKDSLFRVPFVGWSMSIAKHIRLRRQEFSSIKNVYREAVTWLRNDMSVLFFPEGTRSNTDEMNQFLNGAFKLAIKEKRPILPIVIRGTGQAIPRGGWLFKSRVNCTLQVLQPIETSSFTAADFENLRDLTRSKMEEVAG